MNFQSCSRRSRTWEPPVNIYLNMASGGASASPRSFDGREQALQKQRGRCRLELPGALRNTSRPGAEKDGRGRRVLVPDLPEDLSIGLPGQQEDGVHAPVAAELLQGLLGVAGAQDLDGRGERGEPVDLG